MIFRTVEELDSEEAFDTIAILCKGGPPRVAVYRDGEQNYWMEPGYEYEYPSSELFADVAEVQTPVFYSLTTEDPIE